jgi:hypothetical protein
MLIRARQETLGRTVDDPGIQARDALIAEAQPLECTGTKILNHHVRIRKKASRDIKAFVCL